MMNYKSLTMSLGLLLILLQLSPALTCIDDGDCVPLAEDHGREYCCGTAKKYGTIIGSHCLDMRMRGATITMQFLGGVTDEAQCVEASSYGYKMPCKSNCDCQEQGDVCIALDGEVQFGESTYNGRGTVCGPKTLCDTELTGKLAGSDVTVDTKCRVVKNVRRRGRKNRTCKKESKGQGLANTLSLLEEEDVEEWEDWEIEGEEFIP